MNRFVSSVLNPSFLRAPFRGMGLVLWLYVVICVLMVRNGGVFNGEIVGFDDQVRMVQVLDWINNPHGMFAGWYDRTIMRTNAPEGFTSGWSRLVDLPVALIILVAQNFMAQKSAALIAAAIVPLMQLAILFAVAPYFARPLVGKRKARLILPFLIFTSILNLKFFSASGFLVGQVSHHPWYIILALVLFGAAARIVMGSARLDPVLAMGAAIALLNSVGIEAYPLIACATGMIALTAWLFGRPSPVLHGAYALLCGAAGSLLLLPLHQPLTTFFTVSFGEPSIMGVILAGCAALFLFAEYGVLTRFAGRKAIAGFCLALLAAVFAAGLIAAFPRILDGAAAALSPAERQMALREHYEAQPVHTLARNLGEWLGLIMPCLLSLAAGIYATWRAKGRRRALHLCYLGFALFTFGFCERFSRFYHHAMTTACAWLLWAWEETKRRLRGKRQSGLFAFGAFVMLGPFWMLLLPAFSLNLPFGTHVVLFPASIQAVNEPCDAAAAASYINAHYRSSTLLSVPHWQSAYFLYLTDLRLDFLANYPSHDKFIDNYNLFGNPDAATYTAIARRHGIDLIAVCRNPWLYDDKRGPQGQPLMSRLQAYQPPPWLKRVDDPSFPINYALYEVDKTRLGQGQ